ncbi:MAG: hypothetical protein A3G41_04205 [Elusimicrobia bacterium RIFCSPLOWO2_12_FULL_59_9]|nr:MAG: hypothetical protein A3G41_04205 [Elusimicrobia bacterium RIFCSPLOWO2_12_FULL_59_9]
MMQLPTRHIITGGAGFIGSHLTETLLERGDRVVVLDNLQHAQRDWLEQVRIHPRLEICQGDLLHPEELRGLLTASDLVWHLAANTNMVIGAQNPQVDVENGFLATQRLLEWMRSEGTHKLVFASSGAVYGDMARPPASEQYGPLLPVSMYGATKLAGEALLSAYHHVFGMQAWIFRFGNVLGARMSHGVVFDFIRKLRECPTALEILGDGTAEKNYILVEECIDGMLWALTHTKPGFEILNLGSPTTTTVNEIAQIVIEDLGLRNVELRYAGGARGWPGDQPRVYMDVSKLRQLGWMTRYTSSEAVRIATRRYLGKETGPTDRKESGKAERSVGTRGTNS